MRLADNYAEVRHTMTEISDRFSGTWPEKIHDESIAHQ